MNTQGTKTSSIIGSVCHNTAQKGWEYILWNVHIVLFRLVLFLVIFEADNLIHLNALFKRALLTLEQPYDCRYANLTFR